MYCPICDQKSANCDCTEAEKRMYAEIEELEEQVPHWVAVSERLPESGKWCWVDAGGNQFPAFYDTKAAGGWTNGDTWEDFDKSVTHWAQLPEPPVRS
jgi:hypothetical protein